VLVCVRAAYRPHDIEAGHMSDKNDAQFRGDAENEPRQSVELAKPAAEGQKAAV
jgi:hypothetical protein